MWQIRHILPLLFGLCFGFVADAQSDRNYIVRHTMLDLSPLTYTDAMNFKDNADEETFYTYDADGNKLKVEHKLLPVSFLKSTDGIQDSRATIIRPPRVITISKTEYSGGHIYRNNKLQQVNNDYGYWADSTYHYYIKDYQGNVRAVIVQDGTLEEINNYYPYGSLMGAADPGVQPFKYGTKELDRQNGINLYDSQARFYDPVAAITTTQDPLAEKYQGLSPYLWCAGNPMKFVDKNGDSVAVLSFQKNDWRHIALLVQNDKKIWKYYSVNGNNKYFPGISVDFISSSMNPFSSIFGPVNIKSSQSGTFIGGKEYNDLGELSFFSVMDFLTSTSNINGYNYDKAYIIPTDGKQDNVIVQNFKIKASTTYHLLKNNCASAVATSLNSAGIDTYHLLIDIKIIKPIKINIQIPSYLFEDIVRLNSGIMIKK